jgi:hypothetical protein
MAVMTFSNILDAFDRGVSQGAAYMVIKHGDYPVYCQNVEEAHDAVHEGGMTMEVYDLRAPRDQQMRTSHAWSLPPDPRDPLFDLRVRERAGMEMQGDL